MLVLVSLVLRPSGLRGVVAAALLLLPWPAAHAAVQGNFLQTVQLTTSLNAPVGVTHAGDGSGRLFVVEQHGRIRIWKDRQFLASPFLDISPLVGPCASATVCGERGLLGLAFHPDFPANGSFYVYYTRVDDPTTGTDETGDIVLARYQASSDPDLADPASATVLLTIEHSSQANHNGGHIAFGPDGFLYVATGDGGGAGDPLENGQNLDTLLGKILRIDVDSDGFPADPSRNYSIPADNPFAGATPGADELWAYGLRNPWRFSFDRLQGDLYIGDVGQVIWEEIDFQRAASGGGENYGWDCREGAHDYLDTNGDVNVSCAGVVSVDPVLEYSHALGCSVTGGYVFRNLPSHSAYGRYFYGDFCSGRLWSAADTGAGWETTQVLSARFGLTSFGEGENGRLYLTFIPPNPNPSNVPASLQWLAPYTFQDVPPTHWAWSHVEALNESGITRGCDTTPRYCPATLVTRAEMAIFLVRAIHGPDFIPPPPTGVFADVPVTHRAAAFIEQLHADGVTQGCKTSPLLYCPDLPLNRAETAVFLLRAKHGGSYVPPSAPLFVFWDVSQFHWAVHWIEQLAVQGITNGCSVLFPLYCPDNSVTRAEIAAFLTRTFGLERP